MKTEAAAVVAQAAGAGASLALILGYYHNGSQFGSSFNFDYGQIIFSKATIAAPSA